MTVEVLTTDELGDLVVAETFYTKMKSAKLPVRGYDPEERLFGVVVHDHWDKYSDTLFTEVVPWFEEEIPEGPFKKLNLPTEYTKARNGRTATHDKIWEGDNAGHHYVPTTCHGIVQHRQ